MYEQLEIPNIAEKLPEGELGIAKVRHIQVDKQASDWSRIRAIRDPNEYIPEGTYARLFVNGTLVMSDTQMERRSNRGVINAARGHVLIAGLGIGMVLHPILKKPEVTRVTVAEKYGDVIRLVGPSLPHQEKLELVEADIFEWKPPKGTKYNIIYHDVWAEVCLDNLEEMSRLHRRFGRYLAPGGWQKSWMWETLRDQRAREKRRCGHV